MNLLVNFETEWVLRKMEAIRPNTNPKLRVRDRREGSLQRSQKIYCSLSAELLYDTARGEGRVYCGPPVRLSTSRRFPIDLAAFLNEEEERNALFRLPLVTPAG